MQEQLQILLKLYTDAEDCLRELDDHGLYVH